MYIAVSHNVMIKIFNHLTSIEKKNFQTVHRQIKVDTCLCLHHFETLTSVILFLNFEGDSKNISL